jgi:hypothetical protein
VLPKSLPTSPEPFFSTVLRIAPGPKHNSDRRNA